MILITKGEINNRFTVLYDYPGSFPSSVEERRLEAMINDCYYFSYPTKIAAIDAAISGLESYKND